jgi:hypothetical protein
VEGSCDCGNDILEFYEMIGISEVAAQLVASRVVLSSIKLVVS